MTKPRIHSESPHAMARRIQVLRPLTPDQLHRFVRVMVRVDIPRHAIVPGHDGPFEYLISSFFENQSTAGSPPLIGEGDTHDLVGHASTEDPSRGGHVGPPGGGDLLIWANRGGGKTFLGAVATLMDLLFKPGIQIRILGGSLEQSSKMYRYLTDFFRRPWLHAMLAKPATQRRIELIHGSAVEVLAQSERSVRGQHVHKLRCDEVELFKPEIWQAAQLITRSGCCGPTHVRGRVEGLSTMHRPFGLMSQLVDRAHQQGAKSLRLLRWCALDVIQRCPPQRDCDVCPLWDDCQGAAKHAAGFLAIDDLIAHKQRISSEVWASEVMCQRPRRSDLVFPDFQPTPAVEHDSDKLSFSTGHLLAQTSQEEDASVLRGLIKNGSCQWVAGVDFGLRSPFVFLWVRVGVRPSETAADGVVEVLDEYAQAGLTLDQHLRAIQLRGWPKPAWLGVDPAGHQRNSHTGQSDVQLLTRNDYQVRAMRSNIRDGIERVRRRLDHGLLLIHPRCVKLIRAMMNYHFDPNHPDCDQPVKDGPDHLCDALRYLIINLEHNASPVTVRNY